MSDKFFGGADTKATSLTLASALKKLGPIDIIFAGEKTVDGDTGQVGAEVAEFLNIPHISYVDEILEVNEDYIKVVSDILDGRFIKKAHYPVLITVTKDVNVPRIPLFKNKMKARKAEFSVWGLNELKEFVNAEDVGLKGSPTKVKKIEVPKAVTRECRKGKENIDGFLDEIIAKLENLNIWEEA